MNKMLAFLTTLLPCLHGFAQTTANDTLTYRYPSEVLVSAPRMTVSLKQIPFSTTIVPSAVVGTMPRSIAIDEPMKLVPGVKVDNQANGSRIHMSIRGQGILSERGIRGIKILLDEIPINDPTGFAADMFDIDYNTLDRVEVLRGPAASLYGGSASGGIVNVVTEGGGSRPLFAEASATAGSNNFWKGFGQFGGNAGDVNYRLSFSKTAGDGFRVHTKFHGNNLYAKATYTPSNDLQLTPIVSWTDFYHENPEGVTRDQYMQDIRMANPDAVPFNEFLETNRVTAGLTGFGRVSESGSVQFNGYFKRTLFTEANNRTFNHRTINTPGGTFQYTHTTGAAEDPVRNSVSLGADLQWQTIDEHRTDNLHSVEGDTVRSKERIDQRGTGVFLIDKLDLGRRWEFMLSVRYDDIRNELIDQIKSPFDLSGRADFSRFTARVGATYAVLPDISLFTSWGQGFLPPATEELAQNPDHFGGFNIHLTFATSQGFELGSRGAALRNLDYEVTAFFLTTENDFDRYRITEPLRTQETFYRNAGSSRRYGLETYFRYAPDNDLTVQLAYTYSNFQYTNGDSIRIVMDDPAVRKYIVSGRFLPNSPEHQVCADIEYTLMPGWSLGVSVEGLSRTFIDGANIESEAAGGYTLLDARLRYSFILGSVHTDLTFFVRNLADKQYIAFTEPDPGGNAYQAGPRRELFAGLRVRI